MMLPPVHISLLFLFFCSSVQSAAPETHSSHEHSHTSEHPSPIVHSGKMVMDQSHMDMAHGPHEDHDKLDMDMGNKSDHGMGMKMFFHFDVDVIVLFKDWKITTAGGMIASVIGVFLMGMLYEGLKYFREYLFKQYVSSIQFSTVAITGESGRVSQVHKVERHRMMSWPHAMQTALHVIQIVISYFLMLIFMTYNGWLCISVVLGAGVGYFVFGWRKASVVDITEHCH